MIKKLRYKFVIVTMLFMSVTFGILFTINNLSIKYWDEWEMLKNLEWYSESDSFFELETIADRVFEEYDKPIFAVNLDNEYNIIEIQSSSKTGKQAPSKEVVSEILNQPKDKNKWGTYLYVIKKQPDGYLLVMTDTSEGQDEIYRIIGDAFLILFGFLVLSIISFILSRFVTKPAEAALAREKQFISDASHEIKTPLAAISINAQALQSEFDDNKHLNNILSETKRMDALIQKLLKLSYTEEVGTNIEKTTFSLSKCCEEMVLSMESSIYERKIKFNYEIEENISYNGNENDIKQVIAVLLDNAMKNTPENGTMSFAMKKSAPVAEITVRNSENGIPAEDIPHIFERFYQVDKARNSDSRSYGLGLAIAKAITDAHGAKIGVESKKGDGVTFTVNL